MLQNQFGRSEPGSLPAQQPTGCPDKAFGSFVICHCEIPIKSLLHNISMKTVRQKSAVEIPWRQLL
jgi:hypothetical protein